MIRPLRTHYESLLDLALLAMAMACPGRALPTAAVPVLPALVMLALAAFVLPFQPATAVGTGIWRRLLGRLPHLLALGAGGAILFRAVFGLPWAALLALPIWLSAMLAWRGFATVWRRLETRNWWPRLRAFATRRIDARDDLALGEAMVLGTGFYFSSRFLPGFWVRPWLPWFLVFLWVGGRRSLSWHRLGTTGAGETLRLLASLVALACPWWAVQATSGRVTRAHLAVLAWSAVALAGYRMASRVAARCRNPVHENLRWLVLGLTACFLMQGFARYTLHGTGDALWYATMLADVTTQTRAGVFPVWIGQSIYQFNGAIFPLRIAPAFHYLGALLDELTLQTLGVFALQNLLITLIGLGTVCAGYFSLGALLPRRRWLAAGLALLFLACPGVLGLAYNTDLFMSWTTLPWIPLAWFATVRSFRDRGGLGSLVLLGGALGACWWGHSPIALWMTLSTGVVQLVRVVGQRFRGRDLHRLAAGAAAFAAVAAYPIGSVLLYPPEAGVRVASLTAASPGAIVHFLHEVYPAILLPLSPTGRSLGDFQLGYALYGLLLFGLWNLRRSRELEVRVLFGLAVFFVVLLSPLPGLDLALWRIIPGFIRNTTGNWAMNRLYVMLAGTIVFGVAAAAGAGPPTKTLRHHAVVGLVLLGCLWSLIEAAKFARGSRQLMHPSASAVDMLRPENVLVTRFAYFVYPRFPDTFSHGVMDPMMEARLLTCDTLDPITSNAAAALAAGREVAAGSFVHGKRPGINWLELTTPLALVPGRRYLLECDIQKPAEARGVLQLSGRTFFREYLLPASGGPRAFGAGGDHATWLSLWTTAPQAEKVTVLFIPDGVAEKLDELAPFAHLRLLEYNPAALPVQVEGWIPYQAAVRSPGPAWVETPRMYQPYYAASVNGARAEIRKSPDGLLCVRVPSGSSHVVVAYHAPWGLAALFWFSLTSMAGLGLVGAFAGCRRCRHGFLVGPEPAQAPTKTSPN